MSSFRTRNTTTAIRLAIASSLFAGASIALHTPPAYADGPDMERMQVLGSRIKRADIEGANPVLIIDRERIEASGLSTLGDILQNLPVAGTATNTTVNNGGNGETRIDLRNLGTNRVLVLVNGRRWLPGIGGSVDLNNLPTAIIERIEVLKDGASAIYGSDAMAGVVNITTRSDYDGAHASAHYGQYASEGDGQAQAYDFGAGRVLDNGSLYANLGYQRQQAVIASDRDISAVPVFGAPDGFGGSAVTPAGSFQRPGDSAPLTLIEGCDIFAAGEDCLRPLQQQDRFNPASFSYLDTPQERFSAYGQATFDLSESVSSRSEVFFNRRRSSQQLAPTPLTLGERAGESIGLAADAAFNPFGVELNQNALLQRRMLEAGARINRQSVDSLHVGTGLEGLFSIGSRYMDWDLFASHARIDSDERSSGELDRTRLQRALGPASQCQAGSVDGCVPLNLFVGPGGLGQDSIDYLLLDLSGERGARQSGLGANLTGDLGRLPAGTLMFATGYEYRRQSGFDRPDAAVVEGRNTGNSRQPTEGSFDLNEFYLELDIPLLADLPMVKSLELQLAGRHSRYSNFGNTSNAKAGLRWQPVQNLLLRGTYSEGFRAPSISELFLGQSDSFPSLNDPCSGLSINSPANLIANCVSQGVPADGSYTQGSSQLRTIVGGNPDLQPEQSDSVTFGLVYSPEWIPGLDLTIDYYRIRIEDSIASYSSQFILNACGLAGILCENINRGPGGDVTRVTNTQFNTGGLRSSGVDALVRWSTEIGQGNLLSVDWDNAYVHENTFTLENPFAAIGIGEAIIETPRAGRAQTDALLPRWRSVLDTRISAGEFDAAWRVRYIHGMSETCGAEPGQPFQGHPDLAEQLCSDLSLSTNRLASTTYHDARLTWHMTLQTRITAGVNNVFDRQPPVSYQSFENSFDSRLFDLPGRFVYLRLDTEL